MRTRRIVALLAIALALALILGGAAQAHYQASCIEGPITVVGTGKAGQPTIYIEINPPQAVWVFLEMNNHDGLQTGGTTTVPEMGMGNYPCVSHPCSNTSGRVTRLPCPRGTKRLAPDLLIL